MGADGNWYSRQQVEADDIETVGSLVTNAEGKTVYRPESVFLGPKSIAQLHTGIDLTDEQRFSDAKKIKLGAGAPSYLKMVKVDKRFKLKLTSDLTKVQANALIGALGTTVRVPVIFDGQEHTVSLKLDDANLFSADALNLGAIRGGGETTDGIDITGDSLPAEVLAQLAALDLVRYTPFPSSDNQRDLTRQQLEDKKGIIVAFDQDGHLTVQAGDNAATGNHSLSVSIDGVDGAARVDFRKVSSPDGKIGKIIQGNTRNCGILSNIIALANDPEGAALLSQAIKQVEGGWEILTPGDPNSSSIFVSKDLKFKYRSKQEKNGTHIAFVETSDGDRISLKVDKSGNITSVGNKGPRGRPLGQGDALYISTFNNSTNLSPSNSAICCPFFAATLTVETDTLSWQPISVIDMPNSAAAQWHINALVLTIVLSFRGPITS